MEEKVINIIKVLGKMPTDNIRHAVYVMDEKFVNAISDKLGCCRDRESVAQAITTNYKKSA